MSEPKFTGVWIPAGVFQTQNVSLTAKVVYGVVDALDNDAGCFASNAYLSRHLGLGERQVRNILQELDEANLITRVDVDGRRVIRTVEKTAIVKALGEAKNCLGGRKNIATGGGKKLPTYNKEDNKGDKDTGKELGWIVCLPFGSEAFIASWKSWVAYRKEMKKKLTDSSVQAQFKEFALWGEQKSTEAIEQSIKQGWQGLFEPNKKNGAKASKALTPEDHSAF
jgi:hypothetical protein